MKFILKRLLQTIPVIFLVAFFSFAIIEIAPGDVLMHYIRPNMTNEEIEELKEELGLNRRNCRKVLRMGKKCIKGKLGIFSDQSSQCNRTNQREIASHNWLDGCKP